MQQKNAAAQKQATLNPQPSAPANTAPENPQKEVPPKQATPLSPTPTKNGRSAHSRHNASRETSTYPTAQNQKIRSKWGRGLEIFSLSRPPPSPPLRLGLGAACVLLPRSAIARARRRCHCPNRRIGKLCKERLFLAQSSVIISRG